jgi:hypothetical protein
MLKPLTRQEGDELIDTFKRKPRDVKFYRVKSLSESERRELLKRDEAVIAVRPSTWT